MSSAASSTRSAPSRGRPAPASAIGIMTAASTSSTATSRAKQVIQRLADVVSKNGNLLLNIPVRGDGTIDDKEEAILDGIAAWIRRQWRGDFRDAALARLWRGADPAAAGRAGRGRGEAVHRRRHSLHAEGRRRSTRSCWNGRQAKRAIARWAPSVARCRDRASRPARRPPARLPPRRRRAAR